MTPEDNIWRTQHFRQHIAFKINETIQKSGIRLPVNNVVIEEYIFQKANNKEMYLATVARLIVHIRKITAMKMQSLEAGEAESEEVVVDDGMQIITEAFQKLFEPEQPHHHENQVQEQYNPTLLQGVAPPNTVQSMEEE